MERNSVSGSDRRTVLRSGAATLFLFQLGGCDAWLSPREAREKGASMRHLASDEVKVLETFAEALVPGATLAGIAHFVDANLTRPAAKALLTIRYLDVPPPFMDFYSAGLSALDGYARKTYDKPFPDLEAEELRDMIAPMLGNGLEGWEGPPQPLLYLAVRSDAADLVYGTIEAFERMGLAYAAHIEPPSTW